MGFIAEVNLTEKHLYLTRGTQRLHFTFNIDWEERSITFEGKGLKVKYTDELDLEYSVVDAGGLINIGIKHLKEIAEQLPLASIEIKLSHSDTLEAVEEELNKNCVITEYLNQQQKENNKRFVQLMRKKWWLLNPDIVEISYVAYLDTDYSGSDWVSYPSILWKTAFDKDGNDVVWTRDTHSFPALESEITDEETVITVRNPYLKQTP